MIARDVLDELRHQRWFSSKDKELRSASVVDRSRHFEFLEVRFADASSETYTLVRGQGRFDAVDEPAVAQGLLQAIGGAVRERTERGRTISFQATGSIGHMLDQPPKILAGEQSNTSIRYGDSLVLKLFRRLQRGLQPELEMSRFLLGRFPNTPPLAGWIEYESGALGILQGFVPNVGDAWTTTVHRLRSGSLDAHPYATLGEVTARLHVALARAEEPDFAPEPITGQDIEQWKRAASEELDDAVAGLSPRGIHLDADRLHARIDGLDALLGVRKTRHHGDYHLGQVLERPDGDFVIIDFEGEPAKPLEVRREKRSPLRDVAGMLRSFDYARHTANASEAWYAEARDAFLNTYLNTVRDAAPNILPTNTEPALSALELEKAAYEVNYELNNRPDWVAIPLAALQFRP